jgi:hypothetical protein
MTHEDPRERIAQLEAQTDELAQTLESCRKLMLASKIAMAAGGLLLAAMLFGAVRFDPMVMIGAMTAVIGGIVVFGSNTSTAQQAAAKLKDAEALRAELIGRLELRVVTDEERQPS